MAAHAAKSRSAARQRKKTSVSARKKHRFVSFTERVADLRIDPVRRKRNVVPLEKSKEDLTSQFAASLDHWKRSNLSETFQSFAASVEPLCGNLAQLLHYDIQIYENITQSIHTHNALALEPLLDLLVQFARDLGLRFEAHFPNAVLLVANLAGKHPDIDVVEWSFSCLTWLFKYLSRLLVSDLGPLYRAFAPFLGKEPQKPFIVRFAAEAMSFLVRKAAVAYDQDPQPLHIVICTIQRDIEEFAMTTPRDNQLEQYKNGIMSLFINALKGVDRKLHPGGFHLYKCLLEASEKQPDHRHFLDIFYGTTIAVIHYTDSVGLKAISNYLTTKVVDFDLPPTPICDILARTLYLLVAVRKGSRIESWQAHFDACIKILQQSAAEPLDYISNAHRLSCVMLHLTPELYFRSNVDCIFEILGGHCHNEMLLAFCLSFQRLDPRRFEDSLAPWFSKHIAANWHGDIPTILECLPLLSGRDQDLRSKLPQSCESHIEKLFTSNSAIEDNIAECFHALNALPHMFLPQSLVRWLVVRIGSYIHDSLLNKPRSPSLKFSLGICLHTYAVYAEDQSPFIKSQWSKICEQADKLSRCPAFLKAIFTVLTRCDLGDLDNHHHQTRVLVSALSQNLRAPSSTLRMLSLTILQQLASQDSNISLQLVSSMLDIERTPVSFDSSRLLAMRARNLGLVFHQTSEGDVARLCVPYFLFGMLSIKLEIAHTEAIETMKRVSEDQTCEKTLIRLVFDWLQTVEGGPVVVMEDADTKPSNRFDFTFQDFSCSNLSHIEALFADNLLCNTPVSARLEKAFSEATKTDTETTRGARSLALSVLAKIPTLAEKSSRQLIPIFLSWASESFSDDDADADDLAVSDDRLRQLAWNVSDRKAMLRVLAHCQHLRQLKEADTVYQALKSLLQNGDVDVQRLSLEALLSFKDLGLSPYRQNLLNLLDDAHMRDEMLVLLGNHTGVDRSLEQRPPELLSVVLRILYGRMINRTKRAGHKGNRDATRKAIFQSLHSYDDACIRELLNISLGELRCIELDDGCRMNEDLLRTEISTVRRQLGVLRAIESLVETMGSRLEFESKRLLNAVFYCLVRSSRKAEGKQPTEENLERSNSLDASVRQTCIRCINLVARRFDPGALEPYVRLLYAEVLNPRLSVFSSENGQGVSGILKLFSAWADSPASLAFLADSDMNTVDALAGCLSSPHCKDEVKSFVLNDIMLTALSNCNKIIGLDSTGMHAETTAIAKKFIEHSSRALVHPLNALVQDTTNKTILNSSITVLRLLSSMADIQAGAKAIISVATSLLNQPAAKVNPRVKGELVRILAQSLPRIDTGLDSAAQDAVYTTMSSLFGYFNDLDNRQSLAQAFLAYAAADDAVKQVANICYKLNAISTKSVGVPDYDLRLQAFSAVLEISWTDTSAKQARPLVENMLFFLRDQEELAFRSNASLALRKCIEAHGDSLRDGSKVLEGLIHGVILPKLKRSVSEKSELVRQEHLHLLDHLLRTDPGCSGISDLQPLLAGGDEDASFFTNVLHIQHHRRARALRRLRDYADGPYFLTTNVSQFLIPLVEHFVVPKDGESLDHNLLAEGIKTIGSLSRSLEWPQFRAIFRRYAVNLRSESDHVKTYVKLLGILGESLTQALKESIGSLPADRVVDNIEKQTAKQECRHCPLIQSVLKGSRVQEDIRGTLLPLLDDFVHQKDESTVSLRVPVAVTAVKCLKLLQSSELQQRLPALLTDVCNILRSKAQESRDLARKTLAEIAALVGPEYLVFLIRELRTALPRGSQLHVLSFTLHSILIHTVEIFEVGDLDDCLDMIVAIIMEDTLGNIGIEKDAEEYISKMKEVKGRKSYDSMELVAKMVSTTRIRQLLAPLQDHLAQKLDLRVERKIDELLRRIELGLSQNPGTRDQSTLVLCYEIFQKKSNSRLAPDKSTRLLNTDGKDRFNRVGSSHEEGPSLSQQRFPPAKIRTFALNVLRNTIQNEQNLKTPANLHAFIPLIGQALMEPDDFTRIATLRLLSNIISLPLQALSDQAGIYVAECVKIVKNAASTSVEISQAAYKTAATILRERPSVDIRESDVAYLLKRLVPDLEQPSRQGSAFNFLRAVLRRGFVIAEVYEIMDVVATVMVTNQTKGIRDTARESYIQFLLDYPQSRERYAKQINFLTQNMDYKYAEGRQSVMEALHKLFNKGDSAFSEQVMEQAFVPLVLLMINDESSTCREMASVLVKKCAENANEMLQHSFRTLLRSWMGQERNPVLRRASFQVFGLLLDGDGLTSVHDVTFLLPNIHSTLGSNLADFSTADWELSFFALQVLSKLHSLYPMQVLDHEATEIWNSVRQCTAFPHQWVKLSAAKLIGLLFADIARSNEDRDLSSLPLRGSGGILITAEAILELTEAFLRCLEGSNGNRDLADQALRNTVFLGKIMLKTGLQGPKVSQTNKSRLPEAEVASDDEDSGAESSDSHGQLAFVQLIWSCSKMLRRPPATGESRSLDPLRTSLRLLTALVTLMDKSMLLDCLRPILLPLNNLTDTNTPAPFSTLAEFKEEYDKFVVDVRELMEKVRQKAGTVDYLKAMQSIQDMAKQRRMQRKSKRAIERVTDPVKAGRDKRKKNEKKRMKRKERHSDYRSLRRGY